MCRKTDNLKWWALCDTCLSKSSSLKVYFIARCPYLLNVLHRHFCYLMQIAVLEMWRYSGWRTEEDQILFLKILSPVLFIVCGAHHPCHKSMEVITILSISPLKLCRFPEANWHRKMVFTKLHIWSRPVFGGLRSKFEFNTDQWTLLIKAGAHHKNACQARQFWMTCSVTSVLVVIVISENIDSTLWLNIMRHAYVVILKISYKYIHIYGQCW